MCPVGWATYLLTYHFYTLGARLLAFTPILRVVCKIVSLVNVDLYVVIGGRRHILTHYLGDTLQTISRVVAMSANDASGAGRVTTQCDSGIFSFR